MESIKEKIDKKDNKIKIYIIVMPYNVKFAAKFYSGQSNINIINFVKEQMNKMKIRFDPGRIEIKEKNAILLPEYTIGDFLENESEVVVYSEDYGLVHRIIPGDGAETRIFLQKASLLYEKNIGKKRNRDDKKNNNNNQNNKNNNKIQDKNKEKNININKTPSKEKNTKNKENLNKKIKMIKKMKMKIIMMKMKIKKLKVILIKKIKILKKKKKKVKMKILI